MQSCQLRKYGVQATIDFELYEVDGVDLRTDWTPAQADCEVMKDGGLSTMCDNTATDEGSTYSIVLTATEMEAARLVIKVVDAATKVFLDKVILVETYGHVSAQHAVDLDNSTNAGLSALGTPVNLGSGASLAGNLDDIAGPDFSVGTGVTDDSLRGISEAINSTPDVNVAKISGDDTAADNLEAGWDGDGIIGDTFPARQDQLNQIANVSGTAKRAASSYVLTTGTQSANTVSSTEELDGTRHEHTDTTGEMELYYEFNIGSGLATEVKVTGYLQGNNDDLEVYGYDWVSSSFKRIGTLNGQASAVNVVNSYDLLVDMVGAGANEGIVRVQFKNGAFTLTTATLAVDQILVEFTVGVEGYEGGAVWLDTNASNTNTVRGVDGISSNPVSTIAAVNTLLANTNLARVEVAPGSSFTFAAIQANQRFSGRNWTLALGGQSISGSFIEGADISGIATGAAEIHFDHCHLSNVTLPPCDCEACVLEGTFTIGTAGSFFFEDCKSGVAGTSTPILDYGGALNSSDVNFRGYSGGIEIQNMGAGSGSYDMSLEGFGQLVVNANCSATSTIAIRGLFTISGDTTAIAAIVFSDEARFEVQQVTGGEYPLSTDALGMIRIVDGNANGEIQTSNGRIAEVLILTDHTPQTGDNFARLGNPTDLGSGITIAANLKDMAGPDFSTGTGVTDDSLRGISAGIAAVPSNTADEVLTGATHNIVNSWGRRVRELDELIGYEGGAVWLDTVNGTAGDTPGDNGTVDNPVDNITDALTVAVTKGLVRIRVASGSTVTLVAALEGYEIFNSNWTLVLGGQSISNTCVSGATVSGVCSGASSPKFINCHFNNATLPPSHLGHCGFAGTITAASAGDFFFENCHSFVAGTGAPVFDFGSGLNASNVNYRGYSGGVEIRNMGAGSGSYNMSLEGWGQLIINANCSATSIIAIRGNFTVTDNASGAVTLSDDARIDVGQINAQVVDALAADTYAEPASIPGATVAIVDKIGFMYALARNDQTRTADTATLRNNADDGNIGTASLSDDNITATRGKWTS